jgi:hypothetical protein
VVRQRSLPPSLQGPCAEEDCSGKKDHR